LLSRPSGKAKRRNASHAIGIHMGWDTMSAIRKAGIGGEETRRGLQRRSLGTNGLYQEKHLPTQSIWSLQGSKSQPRHKFIDFDVNVNGIFGL
tara:strand:- start:28018 stop:28296 length:279 start_codon:yes stop_codon:yes gene_type:complete